MKNIEGCDWIRRILFVCLFSGPWRALCSIAGLENLLASTVSFVPRDRISGAWDQLRYIRGSLVIGSFIASAKWAKSQGLSLVSTRLGRGMGGFFFFFLFAWCVSSFPTSDIKVFARASQPCDSGAVYFPSPSSFHAHFLCPSCQSTNPLLL